ncbi:MAG: hypothetical protein JXA01_10920 [Dehalococcoidia bacterium]|nr:hypothetical protein [Dehalococcoidia bacterium]
MPDRYAGFIILALIISIVIFPVSFLAQTCPVNAAQRTLSWSIVSTPNDGTGGIIVSPSEINAFALGPDNRTFYLANTSNSTASFYKSTDAGVTWFPDIGNRLVAAGANLPVWDLAVSPDDTNILVAVTDDSVPPAPPSGPRQVFFSIDGGNNWQNTGLSLLAPGEYIGCIDISKVYSQSSNSRDIAVGTRTGAGSGCVYLIQSNNTLSGTWKRQDDLLPVLSGDFSSLKFSPNYDSDYTIGVIYSLGADTLFNLGKHDTAANSTDWGDGSSDPFGLVYPISLGIASPATIIKSCLALPGDFDGTSTGQLGVFASFQEAAATAVLYINANESPTVFNITPPMSGTVPGYISSISYKGSESSGILLAAEVFADSGKGLVNVWRSSNPQSLVIGGATWLKSDEIKSPTGGHTTGVGIFGRANAIVKWSPDGDSVYCGTSSEDATAGGTGFAAGQWPNSKLTWEALDESAFSRSLDNGITWNQTSLIDTQIHHLTDVAAMEAGEGTDTEDLESVLYLATAEDSTLDFYSVWRSTSDPLGDSWERILLYPKQANNDNILRVNPRREQASTAIVFAELQTDNITYSSDQGQTWQNIRAGVKVNDISILNDDRMYVLEDYTVKQLNRGDSGWTTDKKLNTNMESAGHTITIPLKNPSGKEIVVIGSNYEASSVAWADFSELFPGFNILKTLPSRNSYVHVIPDSLFDRNQYIYAGLNNNTQPLDNSNTGTIYRWQIGKSSNWDELGPPNAAFFGLATANSVLYGAWNFDAANKVIDGGVDRTLYSTARVPPPPEWDDLTAMLNNSVVFTREPASLKVSVNSNNTLWAIDNRPYQFDPTSGVGCLWSYVDSVAKLGPWPTSPQTGALIGADPVTGRSQQVDIRWRPLNDIYGYDILLAKDVNFTLLLSQALNLTPVDDKTGAWVVIPADSQQPSAWISPGILEVGRPYYWQVRGSRAISGEIIHSPWSPVMLFSIKPGFAVAANYNGPTLLTPIEGHCSNCVLPMRFSWTPVKDATKYEFVLAADPELQDIVEKTTTSSTAFEYKATLEFYKAYYWQVKAVAPVISDASPIGTFSLVSTADVTQARQKQTTQKQQAASFPTPSGFWIWIIIVIAMVLLILINIYAFISRKRD